MNSKAYENDSGSGQRIVQVHDQDFHQMFYQIKDTLSQNKDPSLPVKYHGSFPEEMLAHSLVDGNGMLTEKARNMFEIYNNVTTLNNLNYKKSSNKTY